MEDQSEFAAVVNCVDAGRIDSLMERLSRAGAVVDTLDGMRIRDKHTLLDEVGRKVFDGRKLANWAQLEDLLRLKILGVSSTGGYALVWTDVPRILDGGLQDLLVATDVFFRMARVANQKGHRFRVFLVGSGSNFQS